MPTMNARSLGSISTVPDATAAELGLLEEVLCGSRKEPTIAELAAEIRALRAEVADLRARQPLRSEFVLLPPFSCWGL